MLHPRSLAIPCLLTLLWHPFPLSAQTGTVQGEVLDASSGDPLPGATVSVKGELLGTGTDSSGRYRLERVDTGSYYMVARYLGYEKQVRMFTVEDGDTTSLDFGLARRKLMKSGVTVTERRREHRMEEPMPMREIGGERIEELAKTSTAELLDDVVGVSAARNGNWGSKPVFQGMSDDRVLTFVDGFKVTQSCPMGMDACAASVPPGMVEGMGVQVGPGGSGYGSGNMGGVMKIRTRSGSYAAKDTFRMDLGGKIGYKSVSNSRTGMLSLEGGKRSFDFALSGGIGRHGNYRIPKKGAYEPLPSETLPHSGFDTEWLHFKGRYRPGKDHRFTLVSQIYRADSIGWPSRMAPTVIPEEKRDLYGIKYRYDPKLDSGSGRLRFEKLKANVGYQPMYHEMVNKLQDSVNTRYKGVSRSENLQAALRTYFSYGEHHRFTLGTEHWFWGMQAERRVITDRSRSEFRPILNRGRLREHAVFLLDRMEISDSWRVDAGVRFNRTVSDAEPIRGSGLGKDLRKAGNVLTWNLEPNFRVNEKLAFEAAVVKGFNAATPVDRFVSAPMLDGYYHYGNPRVSSETNLNKRFAVKGMFGQWNGRIEAFHNSVKGLIEWRVEPDMQSPIKGLRGVRRAANIRKGTITGANADFNWYVTEKFELSLKASYQYGVTSGGEPLPNMAPFRVSPEVRYRNRSEGLRIALRSDLVAAQERYAPEYGEVRTPGYAVFNLSAGWEVAEGLDLELNLENLTNRRYRRHLTDPQLPEPGANISLGVRYKGAVLNKAPKPDLSQAKKVSLEVEGMACRYCVRTVRERLMALPEVIDVAVHLKDDGAEVVVKKGRDPKKLLRQVRNAGFQGEIKKVEDYRKGE